MLHKGGGGFFFWKWYVAKQTQQEKLYMFRLLWTPASKQLQLLQQQKIQVGKN